MLIQKASRTPRDPVAWQEVERQFKVADKTLPQAAERLTLLRVDMLAARDRSDEARSLLTDAQAKDSSNLPYRLALARLAQRQGKGPEALRVFNEAEKDLGPSLAIQLARLDYWGRQGGDAAKTAVAKLAEDRQRVACRRPARFSRPASSRRRSVSARRHRRVNTGRAGRAPARESPGPA